MVRDTRNVVVVVVDALRADRVGVYGSERGLTPVLDSLGKRGTVFENAFCCVNTTDPSITSIHTGKYPRSTVIHHGGLVTEDEKQRIESIEYVPELLSNAGVQTIATGRVMGRWHYRGFDEYSWSSVKEKEMKISESLQEIYPLLHQVVAGCYNYVADFLGSGEVGDSTDAIDDLLAGIDESPFYGFVHLMDTHAWYDAEPELVDLLLETNDYPDGNLEEFFEEYSESPIVSNLLEPNATRADYEVGLARLYARYDATVRQADRKLERLIRGLKEQGRWDDTALFVISDHGESLHEHGIYFDHHGLYDQTVQVPLIVHLPGGNTDRVDDFVQLHELGPTILDLLDVNGLNDTDCRSLVGYLDPEQERPDSREQVVVEEAHTQRRRGIRTDKFKYIEHVDEDVVAEFWGTDSFECGYCLEEHGEKIELYNLHEDPEETCNLAEEKEDVVAGMQDRFVEFEQSHPPVAAGDETVTYHDEDELLERLEELGYR